METKIIGDNVSIGPLTKEEAEKFAREGVFKIHRVPQAPATEADAGCVVKTRYGEVAVMPAAVLVRQPDGTLRDETAYPETDVEVYEEAADVFERAIRVTAKLASGEIPIPFWLKGAARAAGDKMFWLDPTGKDYMAVPLGHWFHTHGPSRFPKTNEDFCRVFQIVVGTPDPEARKNSFVDRVNNWRGHG